MNPFTKGAKVRAVRDTKSYGVGTPIPEGAVLEVARTNEVDAASLFNAIRPDGGEYALAKDDFEPALPLPTQDGDDDGREPAPLDPSKVKAGDTVTVVVENSRPDVPAYTVKGEVHHDATGRPWVGPIALLSDYSGGPLSITLTDHQPALEPEWEDGQIGDALVHGASVRGFISNDGESFVFSVPGSGYHEAGYGSFEDFVPLVVIDPGAVDVDLLRTDAFNQYDERGGSRRDREFAAVLNILAGLGITGIEVCR